MKLYTVGYAVQIWRVESDWTPVATHYACQLSELPPTAEQKDKAWGHAFERAQAREDAGIKVRIVEIVQTMDMNTVWEGR